MPLPSLMTRVVLVTTLAGCAGQGGLGRGGTTLPGLHTEQMLEIASVLEQNGDRVRAAQYLQHALKQGAPPAQVMPRLLHLYLADGQYRQALDQAENQLRKQPRDRSLRLFLGSLYMALGYETEAVTHYARVLAEQPKDAQAHYALASALHQSGRELDRADRHFRAYLELEPHGPHAEEARSLLLMEVLDAPASVPHVETPAPDAQPPAPTEFKELP
jgi:tetratricopeptide (TPR) repeat protein